MRKRAIQLPLLKLDTSNDNFIEDTENEGTANETAGISIVLIRYIGLNTITLFANIFSIS